VAKQAAQKEAVDARKKKKVEVAHRKYKKEKEVAQCMKDGERKRDVESKLELEDPTDVDDMVFSEEEESQEVIVTSVKRHDPTATSAGDEQEAARHVAVPAPRKHAVSADAISEREAKRTLSACPSVASPVPSPPAADTAEQAGWSEERTGTRASPGPVPACESQPEDAPPAAPVGESQAKGRGDLLAGQELVRRTPPPPEVRGHGS